MSAIDLHIHSDISLDGELPVAEIAKLSQSKGVTLISITDHNSARGIDSAVCECKKHGVLNIPGIELDCEYQDLQLHILGYHINYRDRAYAELENDMVAQEKKSIPEALYKLNKTGFSIDEDELYSLAGDRIPSPELMAEALLRKAENRSHPRLQPYLPGGSRSDMPYLNFYRDFFKRGKPAYVQKRYLDVSDIITLIIKSGGVAVVAHPGESLDQYGSQVDVLVQMGLGGIEVFSSYHDSRQTEYFLKKAAAKKLIVTCGSDFHGRNKPAVEIGAVDCLGQEEMIRGYFL